MRLIPHFRCAPTQKAELVSLVMKRLNKVCMSVGDGGNDVPMISMAHVGVGIMGNEGMQAARASDFALGEFRMLIRLLAVHGRYSALRSSELIKYSFYKNLCFATPQVPKHRYNLDAVKCTNQPMMPLASPLLSQHFPVSFPDLMQNSSPVQSLRMTNDLVARSRLFSPSFRSFLERALPTAGSSSVTMSFLAASLPSSWPSSKRTYPRILYFDILKLTVHKTGNIR